MKKQHLFIILSVVLSGFMFGIIQYYQALKIENVSAVTVGTSNPGHSLAQLECSANSLCVDTVNNRIGIGTANPNASLHIYGADNNTYGQLKIQSTGNDARLSLYNINGASTIGRGDILMSATTGYEGLRFMINGTDKMILDENGNVGIGTTAPTTKLDVSGSMTASGMPVIKCPITTSSPGNYMTLGAASYSNGNISCSSDSITIGEAGLYLVGYALGLSDYNHGWLMKNKNGGREISFANSATAIFSNSTILYLSTGDTLQIYHYSGTFTADGNLKYIWATKLH